jgi:hypothetical protein
LKSVSRQNEYNGTCWIERPDVKPRKEQRDTPGSSVKWHPGNRMLHQIKGRTLAMTILQGLYETLTTWSEADDYLLEDGMWHVADFYKHQRAMVQALDPNVTGCGEFAKDSLEYFCTIPMKGRTEFTPRGYASLSSIRIMMPTAMKEIVGEPERNIYEPPDVFNPFIHALLGEVDVLNIVEGGPDFKSVMDPQIYRDFYETLKDNSINHKTR